MTTSVTPRASVSPRSVGGTPRSRDAAARRLRKQCTAPACGKVDAGGGFCVAHGGGKKCAFPGCKKGYQTGGFCRQHGGGARCQVEGCGKVDAGRGLCRAHGGGKRCQEKGCTKADVGGGFCTAHGGGKRCSEPGCTKIDQGGGKCRAHGGARRCRRNGCTQPARGASGLCSDHGGAQLCATPNCRRIAKDEGGRYCTGCAKNRVKSEDERDDDDAAPSVVSPTHSYRDKSPQPQQPPKLMPPFSDLLARASPQYEYAPLMADNMEPFHAFVQAATTAVDVTSPPAYNETFHEPRSPIFVVDRAVDDDEQQQPNQDEPKQDASPRDFGSCIDNGCAKTFGGRCNCKAGCTCCSQAQAAERSSASQRESPTDTANPSSRSQDVVSHLQLQRVVLHIQLSKLPLTIVRSVLHGVQGVRSVHVKPQEHRNVGAEASTADTETSFEVTLRCDPSFSISDLEVLTHVTSHYKVQATAAVDWAYKEIVFRVADMMCPGNCGRTVMTALKPITTIQTANLVFDERCVVARGDMCAKQLCDAIEAVGFEPIVVAELPLPKRYMFRVVDFASTHLMADRLRELIQEVEGVETIVFTVNRAEALIEATLDDAGSLLQAAHANGIMMVEFQEDERDNQTSPFDPTQVDRPRRESELERIRSPERSDHVCDVKVCPHNGCEQYMVTVAHTAALAVGWSVPGCAMGWGGECTCGEQCKCKGCPEHNPLP